jgi:hypothetical protein
VFSIFPFPCSYYSLFSSIFPVINFFPSSISLLLFFFLFYPLLLYYILPPPLFCLSRDQPHFIYLTPVSPYLHIIHVLIILFFPPYSQLLFSSFPPFLFFCSFSSSILSYSLIFFLLLYFVFLGITPFSSILPPVPSLSSSSMSRTVQMCSGSERGKAAVWFCSRS